MLWIRVYTRRKHIHTRNFSHPHRKRAGKRAEDACFEKLSLETHWSEIFRFNQITRELFETIAEVCGSWASTPCCLCPESNNIRLKHICCKQSFSNIWRWHSFFPCRFLVCLVVLLLPFVESTKKICAAGPGEYLYRVFTFLAALHEWHALSHVQKYSPDVFVVFFLFFLCLPAPFCFVARGNVCKKRPASSTFCRYEFSFVLKVIPNPRDNG